MFTKNTESLLALLPASIARELRRLDGSYFNFEGRLSEIRIRAHRLCSVTLDGKNIPISVTVGRGELEETLKKICRGSVYAYSETLREGYVTVDGGYRVGVAGRAVYEGGYVAGVGELCSLCIRIPHLIRGAGDLAVAVWRKMKTKSGILIYSPPGNGKTTMLRDIAAQLSSGREAMRVCIVDCRSEIDGGLIPSGCLVDVLEGYTKAQGIEIATRSLSPELIICDEIGGYDEAMAILDVQSCGVPLVASVHGENIEQLMSRNTVALLAKSGIFGAYIGVRRERDGGFFCTVDYPEI